MFLDGVGTPTNLPEGFKLVRRAADKGLAAAQNRMGERFLHGQGVNKDGARAYAS